MKDLKPKVKISGSEMTDVSLDTLDKFVNDMIFSFKVRENDIMYVTGKFNNKVKVVDLNKPKDNDSALF